MKQSIIQTLWALAVLGQIVFYVLSFSRVIALVHGDGQAIGSLIGIDFLAVALTSMSWTPEKYVQGSRNFKIFIYVLTFIIVFGVMLANIRGWMR